MQGFFTEQVSLNVSRLQGVQAPTLQGRPRGPCEIVCPDRHAHSGEHTLEAVRERPRCLEMLSALRGERRNRSIKDKRKDRSDVAAEPATGVAEAAVGAFTTTDEAPYLPIGNAPKALRRRAALRGAYLPRSTIRSKTLARSVSLPEY
eukprot:3964049-Pleurochrysis_carterae.AAC.1